MSEIHPMARGWLDEEMKADLLALIRAAESAVITTQEEFEGTRYVGKADALIAALSAPSFAEMRKAAGQ